MYLFDCNFLLLSDVRGNQHINNPDIKYPDTFIIMIWKYFSLFHSLFYSVFHLGNMVVKNSSRVAAKQWSHVCVNTVPKQLTRSYNANHAFLFSPKLSGITFSINLCVDFSLYRQFNSQILFSFFISLIKKWFFLFWNQYLVCQKLLCFIFLDT